MDAAIFHAVFKASAIHELRISDASLTRRELGKERATHVYS